MIHGSSCLGRALALSLILHAAVIAAVAQFIVLPAARRPEPDLTVTLRHLAAEIPAPAPPQLLLPQDTAPNPNAAAPAGASRRRAEVLTLPGDRPAAAQPGSPPRLAGEAARKAAEQLQRELLYPREAIERGLQGEALVLLFLDEAGNAVAARIESSSGHVLLDDAAVRAARSLRALPEGTPRDVLLEVRFRLR
jgi:protein TonB